MSLISDSALTAFVMGLYGSLEMRVSTRKPENLNDAITFAIEEQRHMDEISEKHGWQSRDALPASRLQTPTAFRPGHAENRSYLSYRQPYSNQTSAAFRQNIPRDNKLETVAITSDETDRRPPLQFCPNCCLDLENLTFPSQQNFDSNTACSDTMPTYSSNVHSEPPMTSVVGNVDSERLNFNSARSATRASAVPKAILTSATSMQPTTNPIRLIRAGALWEPSMNAQK